MIYIEGVMVQPRMARLATVENLCNILLTCSSKSQKRGRGAVDS